MRIHLLAGIVLISLVLSGCNKTKDNENTLTKEELTIIIEDIAFANKNASPDQHKEISFQFDPSVQPHVLIMEYRLKNVTPEQVTARKEDFEKGLQQIRASDLDNFCHSPINDKVPTLFSIIKKKNIPIKTIFKANNGHEITSYTIECRN